MPLYAMPPPDNQLSGNDDLKGWFIEHRLRLGHTLFVVFHDV